MRTADPDRPDPEEIELKLVVLDRAAIRKLIKDPSAFLPGVMPLGPARTVDFRDQYLDTARGALAKAGFVARIRTGDGARRLTIKSLARGGQGAVHRRLELEGDAGQAQDARYPADARGLGNAGDVGDPHGWPSSAARDRLLDAIGINPLVTLATLQQRRLQRNVALETSVIELSLDEVEVVRPDGIPEHWVELECELKSGHEADLAALGVLLTRRPDLTPATTSKLERALVAASASFTERSSFTER